MWSHAVRTRTKAIVHVFRLDLPAKQRQLLWLGDTLVGSLELIPVRSITRQVLANIAATAASFVFACSGPVACWLGCCLLGRMLFGRRTRSCSRARRHDRFGKNTDKQHRNDAAHSFRQAFQDEAAQRISVTNSTPSEPKTHTRTFTAKLL